jgi:hypothetical protein
MTMRGIGIAAALAAVAAFSGCESYTGTARTDAGEQVSQKSFNMWPIVQANKTVYQEGVQNQGEALFFIKWNGFDRTQPPPQPQPEDANVPPRAHKVVVVPQEPQPAGGQ